MSWDNCLAFGEKGERLVLKKVQLKYPKAYKIEGFCKEWDIFVPEKGIGIEVKNDRASHRTGNVVIEDSYGGRPSGIETTKATWWAYITKCHLYWITPDKIKECIKDNNIKSRVIKPEDIYGGGEYKEKSLYLIKEKEFKNYATRSERLEWQKLM
jgi:hypothetical protein